MVLVEVGEAVVEENGRIDVVRDGDAEDANVRLDCVTLGLECVVVPCPTPLRRCCHLLVERGRHPVRGNWFEIVSLTSIVVQPGLGRGAVAVGVIDRDLLDLIGGSARCAWTRRIACSPGN